MLLDQGYADIVMDGLRSDLYSAVPSSAQRELMLYDHLLRMVQNPESHRWVIVRRCDPREVDPVRIADTHMVGWYPVLTVPDGPQAVHAIIVNLRIMDQWRAHGDNPEAAAKAMDRAEAERKAKADEAKAADDDALNKEFTDWCGTQKVLSTGGDPGKTDASRGDYRILQGVPNETLDG